MKDKNIFNSLLWWTKITRVFLVKSFLPIKSIWRGTSRHIRKIHVCLQNHWIVLYVSWPPATTNEHNIIKVLVSQTRQAMLFTLTVSTSEASQHSQVLKSYTHGTSLQIPKCKGTHNSGLDNIIMTKKMYMYCNINV
jgi:hypothetical protein